MPEHRTLSDLNETPHAELFDRHQPRTVRLELAAGEGVPAHNHPGTDIVLHLLSGRLTVSLDEECYELDAGELLQFSGDREIEPRAEEDSTAVIVFAPAT